MPAMSVRSQLNQRVTSDDRSLWSFVAIFIVLMKFATAMEEDNKAAGK